MLCYPRDLSRVAREHPGEVRSRLSSRYPQHQKSCARTHSHAHTLSHTVRGWGLATVRDDQETLYRLWSELCSLSDDDDDDVYHHIGERLNLEGAEPVRLCQRFAIDIRSVLEESLDRGRQDKIKREGLVQTYNTVQAAQILPTCHTTSVLVLAVFCHTLITHGLNERFPATYIQQCWMASFSTCLFVICLRECSS